MSKVLTRVYLSSLLLILLFGCKTKKEIAIVTKEPILEGKITFQELMQPPFLEWFSKEQISYHVDTETLDDLNNNPEKIKALSVKIFLGTWCEDSQREIPRFFQIIQYLNLENKYELIALDRDKKTKNNLEKGMNIHHVPTFIIYQNGKEINRIVESPIETLEKDIITILQHKLGKYIPNYSK